MGLEQRAQLEAEALSRRVLIQGLLRRLRGQPNQLLPYSAVLELRPKSEAYKGLQTIEVDKIIGSVDRYGDFDAGFMPKEPFALERWTKLRQAQLEGIEFPPIHVYKVGDTYFVKDGNHRTALAKAQGQHFIDAYVIELEVPVELSPSDTVKDVILKGSTLPFWNELGCPNCALTTSPSCSAGLAATMCCSSISIPTSILWASSRSAQSAGKKLLPTGTITSTCPRCWKSAKTG